MFATFIGQNPKIPLSFMSHVKLNMVNAVSGTRKENTYSIFRADISLHVVIRMNEWVTLPISRVHYI